MNNNGDVLFLCRRDDRTDYDTALSMTRGMQAYATGGMTYGAADFEELVFSFDGSYLQLLINSEQKKLTDFSAIVLMGWFKTKILEDVALSVSHIAKHNAVSCLNSEAYGTRSRTKLSQYVIACLHGVRVPAFVFALDHDQLFGAVKQSTLSYPLIAKSVQANRGKDNYLVQSPAELKVLLNEQADVPFVVQQFIPNDGDYRLVVMDDHVTVAIRRQSQSMSHINNTSQGGHAELVAVESLNPELVQDAVVLAKALKREITGADIVVDKTTGAHYVLEVNNMPQLSTGSEVEAKLQALDQYLVQITKPEITKAAHG